MNQFEVMEFGKMEIGSMFYDTVSRENFRKVSDTHADGLTGAMQDRTVYFGQADQFEVKAPIGYQIANAEGVNIQGDDEDSSGHYSFEILTHSLATDAIKGREDRRLYAIYPDDIGNPEFIR